VAKYSNPIQTALNGFVFLFILFSVGRKELRKE
jgi:hypothetical protein